MNEEPKTQIPTIRNAATYIIDEKGNEVEVEAESSKLRAESPKPKSKKDN